MQIRDKIEPLVMVKNEVADVIDRSHRCFVKKKKNDKRFLFLVGRKREGKRQITCIITFDAQVYRANLSMA